MKKILILFILFFNLKTIGSIDNVREYSVHEIEKSENVQTKLIIDKIDSDCLKKYLIESLIYVETNGNNIINETENAIGYLQIRSILVDDINRIVGYDKYKHEDAWNKKKSIEMFWIYQKYYNPEMSLEIAARIWNGGPYGHRKTATKKYWKDVKFKLTQEYNINC